MLPSRATFLPWKLGGISFSSGCPRSWTRNLIHWSGCDFCSSIFAPSISWKVWRNGTSSQVLSKSISGSEGVFLWQVKKFWLRWEIILNETFWLFAFSLFCIPCFNSLCIPLSHPVFESLQKKIPQIALTMLSLGFLNFAAFFRLPKMLLIFSVPPFHSPSPRVEHCTM